LRIRVRIRVEDQGEDQAKKIKRIIMKLLITGGCGDQILLNIF
jgi:hypothetical protein